MATEIWVNIGSGNGLLPDGTKPSPEPMLTDRQWNPMTFILGQFHKKFHSNFPGNNEFNFSKSLYLRIFDACLSWIHFVRTSTRPCIRDDLFYTF